MKTAHRFLLLIAATLAIATNAAAEAPTTAGAYAPPEPLQIVDAEYPRDALDKGIEASVGLTLYIDATGTVVKAEVEKPAAQEGYGFDARAAEALSLSRFKPATQGGVPIPIKVRYTYEFKIRFVPPVLQQLVRAEYPADALRRGIEGSVIADIDVDARGKVQSVEIVKGADDGDLGFEDAARKAMLAFEYAPATRNGAPIPATVTFRYDFALPEAYVPLEKRPVNLVVEIKEAGTRKPLDWGHLSLVLGDGRTLEEEFKEGRYEGRDLPPGTWRLDVAVEGYEPFRSDVTISKGEVAEVTFYIDRDSYEVYGQDRAANADEVVYETREAKVHREVAVHDLSVAEIQRVPGNNGDALKVVQNLPGVARPAFGLGDLIVRGSEPADTRAFLDGAEIPLLYHFGSLYATVNSDSLGGIEFLPGDFSVRHGRAMGGIVEAKTRAPNKERYTGYLDLNLLSGGLLLEGPITKNLSFLVSLRRSWIDAFAKQVLRQSDLTLTVAPRFWDYQGRLDWTSDGRFRGAPTHELTLDVYGSDDLMSLLRGKDRETTSFELKTNYQRAQIEWTSRGAFGENSLLYAFGRDREYTLTGSTYSDETKYTHTIRDELTLRLDRWLDLTPGVDVEVGSYDKEFRVSSVTTDDTCGPLPACIGGSAPGDGGPDGYLTGSTSGTLFQPAAFLELGLEPTESLRLTLGGRYDYDLLSNESSVDVRGAVRWRVLEDLTLKAAAGTFHQPPEPSDLDSETGNPDLGMEVAIHTSLGLEAMLPVYKPLTLEVTGFYKRLDDLVVTSDATVERDGELVPERLANSGDGNVFGLELMLRHDLAHNFFGWISYTLSRSTRRDTRGGDEYLFDYDQTHILTAVASTKLPRHWQVGLRFRYTTGSPYTELTRGAYDADTGRYESVTGERNAARMEPFHELDLRIDKDWVFDHWILTTYLDVQNVYFHANAEMLRYNFDFSEKGVITGLSILPTIGVRGSF